MAMVPQRHRMLLRKRSPISAASVRASWLRDSLECATGEARRRVELRALVARDAALRQQLTGRLAHECHRWGTRERVKSGMFLTGHGK